MHPAAKFYTGWAMEAYPEMDRRAIAHHVKRQVELGANFVWMGHNNPGEVDAAKVEPGLSYAVWEALVDDNDPRHEDAIRIVDAQRRLLDFCLAENIPVVFPIGYQIQMGERWNRAHPQALRRNPDGCIINWGGVSACFYSPEYRDDIRRYYKWVAETLIEPYRPIMIMVNLSDEPFGGDYSPCAEAAFKKATGLTFNQAIDGGAQEQRLLGHFQSNYIVEYARWSAQVWHSQCPDIPSTMSFCGHHAREENIMPSVPALFTDTPEYFHPTFDVYPRDGDVATPISESDIVMLMILLRQLAYLSNRAQKPYWLWTTGNSWGLGQASQDRADITDAVVNLMMAISGALENGGVLRGIAIWNYNVKQQGLYNDTNNTVFNPDNLFFKLTRVSASLRTFANHSSMRPTSLAIVAERTFGEQFIAKSRKTVWVKPFDFNRLSLPAKNNTNLIMDDCLSLILSYNEASGLPIPPMLMYLGSGDIEPAPEEISALIQYLSEPRNALIPEKLWKHLNKEHTLAAKVSTYKGDATSLPLETIDAFLRQSQHNPDGLFHFTLADMEIVYNLSKKPLIYKVPPDARDKIFSLLAPGATIKHQSKITNPDLAKLKLGHHEAAIIADENSIHLRRLLHAIAPEDK